jgi:molecular chaperone GrpE
MTITSETSSTDNNQQTMQKNETYQSVNGAQAPIETEAANETIQVTTEPEAPTLETTIAETPAATAEKTTNEQVVAVEEKVEEKTTVKIEDLTRQLAEMTKKADSHWENVLRKQAELDNFQKRSARDLENARKYALEKFATELLAVKDSMELGIEAACKPETTLDAVREGMTLTLKMLSDTLSKFDIVEINPVEEKFNPQWHEAMTMQPAPNVEEGTVLYVHQKGYQLHERLLRPARVVVAKAMPSSPPAIETPTTADSPISPAEAEKPLENQG